mgnify:FL=1
MADRSFEAVAEHFTQKIYGSLKGQIRLKVLKSDLAQFTQLSDLAVLDIGCGSAQIGLWLAGFGHHVELCDLSASLLSQASAACPKDSDVSFTQGAYQDLKTANQSLDLILSHAVLEWLDDPKAMIDFALAKLKTGGHLSLCFYNPASYQYRNLIMGNFYQLDRPAKLDAKTLTPNNPVSLEQALDWTQGFTVVSQSGIRVFHDYSPLKRGGHTNPEAVLDKELEFSQQEPFWRMGRYLHLLLKKR